MTTSPGDVVHVRVAIVDSAGTVVPTADHLVRFTVAGGSILVVDNANLRDLDPYRADSRRAFTGRGLAIVRSGEPGRLTITASADGLEPASVAVQVVRGAAPATVPAVRQR
jgi:beta-galactosidase